MIQSHIERAVTELIAQPISVDIACTGAGAGVAETLWQVPGISKILNGFSFPYHSQEFNRFVGMDWKEVSGHGYCSQEAAYALAQAAYFRCQENVVKAGTIATITPIGIGLSASVTTNRHLRGGARVHAALRTPTGLYTASLPIDQDRIDRKNCGRLCNLIALNLLLQGAGLPTLSLPAQDPIAPITMDLTQEPHLISIDGSLQEWSNLNPQQDVIFPGSFNPLSFGHVYLAQRLQVFTGKRVIFEITSCNADKTPVPFEVISQRVQQFRGVAPVIVTNRAPLFIDKAREYGGASFLTGADTAHRILEPRFYSGENGVQEMLSSVAELGSRFYVSPRQGETGIESCINLPIPDGFKDLFINLPGLWDVSSTLLRG